ncbi:class I SAM-dependent methyltransferase [Amycolatopsis sp. 195334CR]|uniref:class I SAM-dependent methyltransferase n=1 Tax=Amycolatopsis sp. 195334CR TaxID=2814588 RepID=UPI001A905004|nr:methyltransferase domain-containing protein [Amycolatopsis sp. 195334CR]MBN6042248.1 methyltransferase domain-containing protein [Amycolatopsis sp. 195334CR]
MPPSLDRLYGTKDLSRNPCFAGGFINFGYWAGIDPGGSLGEADRVRSQEDLYRLVLRAAEIEEGARLVEVGCGRGLGCALALREFGPHSVCGVDAHPAQVERAARGNSPLPDGLEFRLGTAASLPFPDSTVDRVYSVEAAQHFPSLEEFAREAARVLPPGGRLAVSTFFAPHPGHDDEINALLHSFAEGLDVAHPIEAFADTLASTGFTGISVRSIGEHVWAGYDRWIANTIHADDWPRNFLRTYTDGLLDYYLITARTP